MRRALAGTGFEPALLQALGRAAGACNLAALPDTAPVEDIL